MRITPKFKNALLGAKADDIEFVIVTKGGKHGNTAIVEIPVDELLNQAVNTNFDTGYRGRFPTKKHPRSTNSMQYMNLYYKYKDYVQKESMIREVLKSLVLEIIQIRKLNRINE